MNPFFDTLSQDDLRQLDQLLDDVLDLPSEERRFARLNQVNAEYPHLSEPLRRMLAGLQSESPLQRSPMPRVHLSPDEASSGNELAVGSMLGPWRIEALAGHGGMATVYRAERADGNFQMTVAIKLLGGDGTRQAARFRRERDLLARLDHPNIARLIDGGVTHGGQLYLVMSWVEGDDLDVWLARNPSDLAFRISLFTQIGGAVAYAHQQLTVHRDIKPGNVRVTEDGRAVLLDFGIAKLNDEAVTDARTQALFTPEYAAPEQLRAEGISTLTDVYALGTLLFVMLTGHHPFPHASESLAAAVGAICHEEPPLASRCASRQTEAALRGDLDAIIAKCLQKAPAARYPSVSALLEDLTRHASGIPVLARNATRWYRGQRFLRRHWLSVGLGTLASVSLIGGLIGVTWQADIARNERDAALREAQRQDALREHLMLIFRDGAAQGSDVTAKQMLDASAMQLGTLYGDDPVMRRSVLLALGELYFTLGDMPAARSLLERFLDLADPATDANDLALAQHQLAAVLLRQGDLQGAENKIVAAETVLAELPQKPTRLRAHVMNVRSALLRQQGAMDEGVALQRRSVEEIERASDAGPLQIGIAQSNLGVALLQRLELDEAAQYLERALATWAAAGLDRTTNAATALGNLGTVDLLNGDYTAAEASFQRARQMNESGRAESSSFGALLANLARTLMMLDRLEEAQPLAERAVELVGRLTGEDTPDFAGVLLTRAEVALAQDQVDQAHAFATRADVIMRARLGDTHPLVRRAELSVARIEAAQRLDNAAERLDEISNALLTAPPILQRQAVRGSLWAAEAWWQKGDTAAANRSAQAALTASASLNIAQPEKIEMDFWLGLTGKNPANAASALSRLEAQLGPNHRRMRALRGLLAASVEPPAAALRSDG